ncbi:MAG: IclR family transcriptional regulator [Burkholderiaceae bacterium]
MDESTQASFVSENLTGDTLEALISHGEQPQQGLPANSQNPDAASQDRSPPNGSAVMRAIEILEVVTKSSEKPQLADICRAVGLPKATVYRILGTLEHAGFVVKEPGAKRYQCGHRLHEMSLQVLRNSPANAARHAILEELVEQLGETCNLTVPDQHTVSYLDRVEAAWPLRVSLKVGSTVPLYASASGKLFLSGMSRRSRDRFLRASPLINYTPNTFTDPDRLNTELEVIRRQGYALDNEEYLLGISCLAVPVRNMSGELIAAVAAHGSSSRLNADQATNYLGHLQDAASSISKTFAS